MTIAPKCDCGILCQDKGRIGGCRYTVPTGACCVCNAQNVEVSRALVAGIETFACERCCGPENPNG